MQGCQKWNRSYTERKHVSIRLSALNPPTQEVVVTAMARLRGRLSPPDQAEAQRLLSTSGHSRPLEASFLGFRLQVLGFRVEGQGLSRLLRRM